MNRKEMLGKVKEQLSRDYNCSMRSFNNEENLITDYKVKRWKKKLWG